ncbi:hypothetical protein EJB05_46960, partial [Eragrostis curvula]
IDNLRKHGCKVPLLLCLLSVIIAWIYSEILESRKSSSQNADPGAQLDNQTIEEYDKAALLGGLSKSPYMKFHNMSTKANLIRFIKLDTSFLLENHAVLRAMAEFGIILVYFYICDRTNIFPESKKSYSRDLFLFLYILVIIASTITSLKKHHGNSTLSGKPILYLNRHQTDEWRGWMQVLFLMYHYFAASEIYNAIRVFIAAYVWMTGYGNFSYYYDKKDFTIARFAQFLRRILSVQMMWRLNFFVAFCCMVLDNSYMLYYISPMSTLFTLMRRPKNACSGGLGVPSLRFRSYRAQFITAVLKNRRYRPLVEAVHNKNCPYRPRKKEEENPVWYLDWRRLATAAQASRPGSDPQRPGLSARPGSRLLSPNAVPGDGLPRRFAVVAVDVPSLEGSGDAQPRRRRPEASRIRGRAASPSSSRDSPDPGPRALAVVVPRLAGSGAAQPSPSSSRGSPDPGPRSLAVVFPRLAGSRAAPPRRIRSHGGRAASPGSRRWPLARRAGGEEEAAR